MTPPISTGSRAAIAYGQNILSSSDDDDYYDIALNYGNTFANGVEFAASVAYAVRDFDDTSGERKDTIGSASVLLPSGFSFTAALGTRDDTSTGASDPDYWYTKLAYEGDWVSWGKTGVGIDYFDGSDFENQGSSTKSWGIAVVQRIDSINTDAYLKYRNHDFDDTVPISTKTKRGFWALSGSSDPGPPDETSAPVLSGAFFFVQISGKTRPIRALPPCAWAAGQIEGVKFARRAVLRAPNPMGTTIMQVTETLNEGLKRGYNIVVIRSRAGRQGQ